MSMNVQIMVFWVVLSCITYCKWIPKLRRNMFAPILGSSMEKEAAWSSETLVSTYYIV